MTKHLSRELLDKCCAQIGLVFRGGRADTASKLHLAAETIPAIHTGERERWAEVGPLNLRGRFPAARSRRIPPRDVVNWASVVKYVVHDADTGKCLETLYPKRDQITANSMCGLFQTCRNIIVDVYKMPASNVKREILNFLDNINAGSEQDTKSTWNERDSSDVCVCVCVSTQTVRWRYIATALRFYSMS